MRDKHDMVVAFAALVAFTVGVLACDSPTAPDGAFPPPTLAATPEPMPPPVKLACIPLNLEFERPEFTRPCRPVEGEFLDRFALAREAVRAKRPDLFGERAGGFQVLTGKEREYQLVLADTLEKLNPDLCFKINPRQNDEIFTKLRGVPAASEAIAYHVDHLCEPCDGPFNCACEFCAAQSSPPIF